MNTAQNIRRVMSLFIIVVLVLVAGSVVCFASGQPNIMMDCGNQMSGPAICRFMSVSLPAIIAVSVAGESALILILAAVFSIIVSFHKDNRRKIAALSRRWHSQSSPPASFLNPVLRLISQGILHSRVFGF